MKRITLSFFFLFLSLQFREAAFCELSYAQKSALGQVLVNKSSLMTHLQFTYNIDSVLADTLITGSSSIHYENGMAFLSANGSGDLARLSSKMRAFTTPALGVSTIFAALFGKSNFDTRQLVGVGNETDGFFFEQANLTFNILYRNNSKDIVISQSDWNVDPMNGKGPSGLMLDVTKGNIFKIQYQTLGFGSVNFFIESPSTGELVLVHMLEFANALLKPSLSNPGLQLMAEVTSADGNATLTLSSMSLFLEGELNPYVGIRNSVSGNASVDSTPLNILSIKNNEFFSSLTNQLMVIPDQVCLFNVSGGSGDAIFKVYLNPKLESLDHFTDVSRNSVISYDVSGTTFNEGVLLGTFYLRSGFSLVLNLQDYGITLSPGDLLVFSCETATHSNITVYASVSWVEQF